MARRELKAADAFAFHTVAMNVDSATGRAPSQMKSGRRFPSGHGIMAAVSSYGPDYSRSPVKFNSSWKMLMKFR